MNEISINISIAGRKYPLTIAASEEQNIRAISKMINEKMHAYGEQFSLKDNQDALAMFAIELATEYQKISLLLEANTEQTSKKLLELKQLLAPVQL
ncbi:MAG: cell division protein ZapA [Bacteroidia bacterium]